jgi:hypothetical protein
MAQFRHVLQSLAGVILLGTPHSTAEDDQTWQNAALAMKTGIITKKKRYIDTGDSAKLAQSSIRFEQAAVSVPILSIYEIQETKVRTSLVSSLKLLVSFWNNFLSAYSRPRFVFLSQDVPQTPACCGGY